MTKNGISEIAKTLVNIDDSHWFGILTAVVVLLITLVIISLWRRKRNARQGVLILGLCDSGKTLIYSRLLYGKHVMTQTSIKENMGDYVTKKGFLRVVDIPGHERVRGKFIDDYKSTCRGVMFVIDSTTIQKEIRDVAEFLYTILTEPALRSRKTNFLVVCNKQDQTMAKGSKVIKALLEKELNILRTTKTHQLTSIEGSSNNQLLGQRNEDFEFSHCSQIDVEFSEASAFSEDGISEPDLGGVTKWLEAIA